MIFHIKKGLITVKNRKNAVRTVYRLRYASIYSKKFKYNHILRYRKNKIQFKYVVPFKLTNFDDFCDDMNLKI